MSICLITPTRNRPAQFAQLEQYMKHQTEPWQEWVVVCDGNAKDYNFTLGQTVVARDPANDAPGSHSVCLNYLAALDAAKPAQFYLCIEDDDYYARGFITFMVQLLCNSPLVGLSPAYYYHTGNRAWMRHWNDTWSSLATTGFTAELIPFFRQAASRADPFIDIILWQEWAGGKLLTDNWQRGRPLQVGLKDGSGIGLGHYLVGPVDDSDEVLRWWLGPYWKNYPKRIDTV